MADVKNRGDMKIDRSSEVDFYVSGLCRHLVLQVSKLLSCTPSFSLYLTFIDYVNCGVESAEAIPFLF